MQAIILANRSGSELTPLNQHYSPAMLSVGSKRVIEYTLEDLAGNGIKNIKMIISTDAKEIEQYLQQGLRWGVNIEYFLSKPEENTLDTLNRLTISRDQPTLIIRGDMLRSPCVEKFVEFSARFPDAYVQAKMQGISAGMMLLPAAIPFIDELNWPLTQDQSHSDAVTLVLHGHNFHLDSLQNYHQANLKLVQGEIKGLSPSELFVENQQLGGFYLGEKVQLNKQSMRAAMGLVAAKSWLDASVVINNTAVIGDHCLVGANSILNNCVVLPNTYVGEGLELNNVIVSKNLLINLDNGGHIEVDDPSLLAANDLQATTQSNQPNPWLRLTVLLSAPIIVTLTLILSMASLLRHPGSAFIADELTDNQGNPLLSWRLNLNNRLLSILPQLRHVVSGRLALFGASASNHHAPSQNTQTHKPQTRGVFGPVQLLLPNNAPEEERRLVEMSFTHDTNTRKYSHLIMSTLKQSFGLTSGLSH